MQPDQPLLEPFNAAALLLQGPLDGFALPLHRITNRIRQSLELPEILTATVAEVRAFLGTDRVKVYRFHEDGSGEVVAEAIQEQRLPSLLGHNFPAEDIPDEARELFLKARARVIVDVASQQRGISLLEDGSDRMPLGGDIRFRPVDPCHVEYLTAMGVQSSLVVPILERDRLWGLLVSHHSEPRSVTEQELQIMQLTADQVAIAISQSNLLSQTRLRAAQEATINQVVTLLHATPAMQMQEALEQTIAALQGFGGRIYIAPQNSHQTFSLFTYSNQPVTPEFWRTGESAGNRKKYSPNLGLFPSIEQHPYWQTWLEMEESVSGQSGVWAIADLYRAVMPSDLSTAFLTAQVRGLLTVRLQYQQQTLGYLSVFRHEIETERIWAGRIDQEDPRQLAPRQSFETWRELKQGQAHPWTPGDIELVQALGDRFAVAIHQRGLYHQVQALNADLQRDIQKRKQAEAELSTLNVELEQRVLERTAELQRANTELQREITERERALVERQLAEASLERCSYQNELILNSAGEGIYGLDPQGKIIFANPAAARMLGYQVEQLIDQSMHTCLNHAKSDGTPYLLSESSIYTTLRDGTVQYGSEDRFQRQDGSSFPVEYVSSPIQEQGRIVGAVVIFKDITDRQLVEQMKDEFVSIVSHELRTPLTSVLSTLGLLASGWLTNHPEKGQRMLEIAFSNTNRLVRLISDILDVERINFGKVAMEKRICNAADLMIQSVDVIRAMAEKAGVNLCITPVSADLWVDSDRIIQTFTNLLNNAIKFSPPNTTVGLTAEIQGSGESDVKQGSESTPTCSHIVFRVQDQGIGIPKDKLETIFDRFQQVDASNSRSQGGTGLGLAICRGIVQQHGGRIWVESKFGAGSTFCFTLPLAEPEERESSNSPYD